MLSSSICCSIIASFEMSLGIYLLYGVEFAWFHCRLYCFLIGCLFGSLLILMGLCEFWRMVRTARLSCHWNHGSWRKWPRCCPKSVLSVHCAYWAAVWIATTHKHAYLRAHTNTHTNTYTFASSQRLLYIVHLGVVWVQFLWLFGLVSQTCSAMEIVLDRSIFMASLFPLVIGLT